jgi:mannose-6-phosphate isomerase
MPCDHGFPPLTFTPIFKEKIWGGQSLRLKLDKNIPRDLPIGESWELSGVPGDESKVLRGPFAGQTLSAIVDREGARLLGNIRHGASFPLLYKFIDANDDLSIQLHPNDQQARTLGLGDGGKTECWYIIDALPETRVLCGFKEGVGPEDVKAALDAKQLPKVCNFIPVSPGDVVFVPAGTVHATLANTVLYEVQQTSDVTFRLYDWDRVDAQGKPRRLHIAEALNVLDMTFHRRHVIDPVAINDSGVFHAMRIACRYFAMEEYRCEEPARWDLPLKKSFQVITVLSGSLRVYPGPDEYHFVKGETILLPACSDRISIRAEARTRMLVSYVPDLVSDIISPLLRIGVSRDSIEALGGNPSCNDLIGPLKSFFS